MSIRSYVMIVSFLGCLIYPLVIVIVAYIKKRKANKSMTTLTSTATIEPECIREPVKEKPTHRRTKADLIALAKAEHKRYVKGLKRLYCVERGGFR